MASVNVKKKVPEVRTHGGAPTRETNAEEKLRRSVMTCLLWEDAHYEDGKSIADRIKSLVPKVDAKAVYKLAIEARNLMKLRHVPLLLAREMARHEGYKALVADLLPQIIQRPDELTELLAIYWKDGRGETSKLSGQVKKGLAAAFGKFKGYSLAKYNKDGSVRLRDVLRLCHAKAKDEEQDHLWKGLLGGYCAGCWNVIDRPGLKLKNGQKKCNCPLPVEARLETPDTWEVELSAKGNNKLSWERLLDEGKLGGFALIRNLRNMTQKGVDKSKVRAAFKAAKFDRVLPFRFMSAAIHAPGFEPELEDALFKSVENKPKLPGKTILVVDVSGSMYGTKISEKSEMDRARTACAFASIARELCEDVAVYATAGSDGTRVHKTQLVPPRRGFALSDAVYGLCKPLGGGGIFLKQVCDYIYNLEKECDRLIVITDEQDCGGGGADSPANANAFGTHNYIVNVNVYVHGIAYKKKWCHINGWSEAVLDFIRLNEGDFHMEDIQQFQTEE